MLMILFSQPHPMIYESIISFLSSEFAMKDLGPLSYFLGISNLGRIFKYMLGLNNRPM